MRNKSQNKKRKNTKENKELYSLEVFLISGPVTQEFMDDNPVISRSVQILGEQTLGDLHLAIFKAFDREEEHMYEFQIGGKGPQDPKAKHYASEASDDSFGISKRARHAAHTTIGSLGLKENQALDYWFDYGDDWWHQINVVSIKEEASTGRYPKVTKRVGESPPQYVSLAEE